MGEERTIALGIGLIIMPILFAGASLFLGLTSEDLTLVYLSIALSVVAVPAMVVGIVLLVRGASSR